MLISEWPRMVYHQAVDIVDGIMINVPSREAQARLIGVRSNLYEGHFRLVGGRDWRSSEGVR